MIIGIISMGLLLVSVLIMVYILHIKPTKNIPKEKESITVSKWREDEEYRMCDTEETSYCPFCKCTNICSGSWTPEYCPNCDAVWYFGTWLLKK